MERQTHVMERSKAVMHRNNLAEMKLKCRADVERQRQNCLERSSRAISRSGNHESLQNSVQKKPIDTIRHYLLHPVILSTIGQSNDFFFHVIRMMWNDRNTMKDLRCQKLLQGICLKEDDVESLDIKTLARTKGEGWFSSSRKNDLTKIGKIAGYFLKRFACAIAESLDENYNFYSTINNDELNNLCQELKNNRNIVPVIIQLDISSQSDFDVSRFLCLPEDIVNILASGEKRIISRRVSLLEISSDFQEWSWCLMNSPAIETRRQLIDDLPREHLRIGNNGNVSQHLSILPSEDEADHYNDVLPDEIPTQKDSYEACRRVEGRATSSRLKKPNAKYPSELFLLK